MYFRLFFKPLIDLLMEASQLSLKKKIQFLHWEHLYVQYNKVLRNLLIAR